MANTYYDSQLTAAEIEAVLEAIDGVIAPANNGKVLAINNGKIEARSVQWGGGGASIEPLSVTQNGTYTAPSGVDGYSPITVNVSGGGGGGIDLSYLPNSVPANVLASKNVQFLNFMSGFINLSAQNTDVTCYCCLKCLDSSECILMSVPYSLTNGNAPSFYTPNGNYNVDCTVFANNTNIPGLSCSVDHVYALSIDSTNRKVRYFYDGVYFMEKSFSNSGDNVCFGRGLKNYYAYTGTPVFSYIGVVSGLESDSTIIANMQTIMQKLGMT